MITPDSATHLARVRRARGGETWIPIPDAAMYAFLPANTIYHWIKVGRIRRNNGHVDLGELLEVRDNSTARVLDLPITYRSLAYLRLVAAGHTSAEVAAERRVTRDAVDSGIKHAVRMLGARSRTHAVALLMASGHISGPEVGAPSTGRTRQMVGRGA